MTIKLYGIPNCDQVKKARTWLNEHQIANDFHDFKKDGVTSDLINAWLAHTDWQSLLNRRGTTWRKLPESQQMAVVDAASAVHCMVNSPSIIKRPVLVFQNKNQTNLVVGFSEDNYQQLFGSNN